MFCFSSAFFLVKALIRNCPNIVKALNDLFSCLKFNAISFIYVVKWFPLNVIILFATTNHMNFIYYLLSLANFCNFSYPLEDYTTKAAFTPIFILIAYILGHSYLMLVQRNPSSSCFFVVIMRHQKVLLCHV